METGPGGSGPALVSVPTLCQGTEVEDWKETWRATYLSGTANYFQVRNDLLLNHGETFAKDKAIRELQTLKQKAWDVTGYIAKFQRLVRVGELDGDSTLETLFTKGLNHALYKSTLKSGSPPKNLSEWYTKTVEAEALDLGIQHHKSGVIPMTHSSNKRKARDPDAMDVDTIAQARTEEDRVRFRKEGRCFFCEQKGHMAKECPKKKKDGGGKPQVTQDKKQGGWGRFTKAIRAQDSDAASVASTSTAPPPAYKPSTEEIVNFIKGMGDEEREKMADLLDEDFSEAST